MSTVGCLLDSKCLLNRAVNPTLMAFFDSLSRQNFLCLLNSVPFSNILIALTYKIANYELREYDISLHDNGRNIGGVKYKNKRINIHRKPLNGD